MSSTLDINAIREYLLKVGCRIEYPILVNAFKKHLYNPDSVVQGKIRTQFKDYVNRLATVSLENNMKFINLRPEFRPQIHREDSFAGGGGTSRSIEPPVTSKPPATTGWQNGQNVPVVSPRLQEPPVASMQPPPPLPQHYLHQTPPPPIRQVVDEQALVHQPQQLNQYLAQPAIHLPPKRLIPHNPQLATPQSPQLIKQYQQQPTPRSTTVQQPPQPFQQPPPLPPQQFQLHQPQPPPINRSGHMSIQNTTTTTTPTSNGSTTTYDVRDGVFVVPHLPPPPPLASRRTNPLQRPESLDLSSSSPNHQLPPPQPPPRRRQSTASLFRESAPIQTAAEKSKEILELAKRSPGRVKEHAHKLNLFTSSNGGSSTPLKHLGSMKENRLSRDPSIAGSLSSALHRSASHLTNRSRSSHREDESDSSSLQPMDPLRRKWCIEASQCNYNGLLTLLREDPKLATFKDLTNGYTALHWAAKFGHLDVIKLMAGTHGVSANIKSSAGYTPLHVARIFNRNEAADLLLKSYQADPKIRDYSGKMPSQYCKVTSRTLSRT